MSMFSDGGDDTGPLAGAGANGHGAETSDMRTMLQALLDDNEKQLSLASTLGQKFLAQRMELEERINQIIDHDAAAVSDDDDEHQNAAREKLQGLAEAVQGWQHENEQLVAGFGSSKPAPPPASTPVADPAPEEPVPSSTRDSLSLSGSGDLASVGGGASATRTAAQSSRRAKNAQHRANDVEFAFEIGSGLLTEVRRLQSLLGERDKAIQDLKEEKDDLERNIEGLRAALRTQEGTADKYKEENWNLEVQLQELRVQLEDVKQTAQRLDGEHKRTLKQLAAARDTAEQHKSESDKLAVNLEEFKSKHETDVAHMRKQAAALARDKSDLQGALDALKSDIAKKSRAIRRFGSPMTPGTDDPYTPQPPEGDDDEDPFGGAASTRRRVEGLTPADPHMDLLGGEPLSSPEPSPIRAPNHPANEIEALKQALAHANRQIATLKGTVQREKARRMDAVRQSKSFAEAGDDDEEEDDDDEELDEGETSVGGKDTLTPLRPTAPRRGRRVGGAVGVRKSNFLRKIAAADSPAPARTEEGEDEDEDMDPAFANLNAPGAKGFLHGASPLRKSSRPAQDDDDDVEDEEDEPKRKTRRAGAGFAKAPDSRPQSLIGAPTALAAELGITDSPSSARLNGDNYADAAPDNVRVVEKIVEVPVEKIVEVPVEKIVEVTVEKIVEVPVEKIVEVEKVVEVPVEVEKIVERIVEVPVDRIVEVPVEVEKVVERIVEVPVERIVEKRVEVPVEKIVERVVEVPVEKVVTVEKIVHVPVPATDDDSNKTDASIAFPGAYARTPGVPRKPSGAPPVPASAAHRAITSPIHPVAIVSDDEETEHEAGGRTETEYEDARSVLDSTPMQSVEFFTATDREEVVQIERVSSDEEDGSDVESIKASRLPRRSISGSMGGHSPYGRRATLRPVSSREMGVETATRTLVEEAVDARPEMREMNVQTDVWSPPPVVPAGFQLVPIPPPGSPGGAGHQFQYIPPASPASRPQRDSGTRDPRPSIQSALKQADQPRASTPGAGLVLPPPPTSPPATVDRTRPPTMMLPPPPRMPPPPEKVAATAATTGSLRGMPKPASVRDVPPPRPTSPPPPQLLQRATTPTFGAMLHPPGSARKGTRDMGPPQSVRGRPSDNSFRSGSTHLQAGPGHAQYASAPAGPSINSVYGSPRHGPRSTTSLVSSARSSMSRRSSVDSQHRPQPVVPPVDTSGAVSTDPTIIHAITQTMIGEFLYKYTRPLVKRGGAGEKRHRRFFWVHPYTRTLYWSAADPGSINTAEASAKSAYIEGVRSVLDPNPSPPGLYPYSVVVSTPQREMKFTAPTKERHDIWFNALKYLLARPNPQAPTSGAGNAIHAPSSPTTPHHIRVMEDDHRRNVFASPQSARSARSAHSGQSDGWNNITPKGFAQRSQTSVGKRTGTPALEYLRWAERAASPTPEPYEYVHGPGNDEDLDFEINDSGEVEGYEGLDNVRACCDGMHDLGTLSKAGHRHHHHHHHHVHAASNNAQEPPAPHSRPVSPAAWSMRSGSQQSHGEGGTGGLFQWNRDQDGKRSWFGSKRSAKGSTMTS